ncbi:MAG: DNA repair protein [Alphaproteobacteria bacterium]|nr:DNA repair protein [Alphaproteobacteria bacterium]
MNETSPRAAVQRLSALRRSLEKVVAGPAALVPLGHPGADLCLKGGLRLGALHEVFAKDGGNGAACGFAAGLAQLCQRGKSLLWVRQDFSALEHGEIHACGFSEFGISPARLFLMRAANATDALRGGLEALSCPALGAVILEIPGTPKILDLSASRRLGLAAQSHGVTAILLRLCAMPAPSACETRWTIAAASSARGEEDWEAPRFDVGLSRNRHGAVGHWVMEWSEDGFSGNGEGKAHPGAVAAASFDRSHPAQAGLRRRA